MATWTPSTSPTNIAQASASYLYSPYGVGRTPGIIGDFDYSNVIYATQSILPAANGGDYPHANPVIDDSGNVYAVTAVDFAMTYLIDDPDLGVLTNNATWTEASIFNYSGGSATQIGETTFGNNMGNNPFGVNDAHTYWITGQGGGILMGQASSLLGDSGFTFYYDGSFHDMSGLSPIAVNSLGEVLANGASTTNGFTVVHPATTNATPYLNRLRSTDSVAAWNKSHQMVGSGSFFYDNGTRYNLNDLLFGQSGWSNASPSFINDSAAISGAAQTNGVSHAVVLLPNYITRDGNMVNSTNNTVWVGQQINLTNYFPTNIPPSAITSYQWHIPGANNTTNDTAFYDYEPTNTLSNYTNLFTPTNYTTNSYVHFYWSSGGSNQVLTCQEVIYGQTNTVSAAFNVSRPTDTITTPQIGTVTVGTSDSSYPGGQPAMYFGDIVSPAFPPGITFTNAAPSASSIGTNFWVQLITRDVITLSPPTTNFVGRVGLDSGAYPYQAGLTTQDSPDNALSSIRTSTYRTFNATMYLMWQANSTNAVINGDKTIPVPLKSYPWNWSATATNTGGTWTLVPGSAQHVEH